MVFEVKMVKAEEMKQFLKVAGTALMFSSENTKLEPEWTLCGFENGKIVTSYAYWPLFVYLNGKEAAVPGVTMVGTLPAYRAYGYLRKVITHHCNLLHEQQNGPITELHASRAAIYQRFGYGIVTGAMTYKVEPRYIEFACPQAIPGRLRDLEDSETDVLDKVYTAFTANKMGYLHRFKLTWDLGTLFAPTAPGMSLNKVVYEEKGNPLGYVIYTMGPPGPGAANLQNGQIFIRDLAWLTPAAYRGIWAHFANNNLIEDITWGRVPVDDPLPYLLLEPRMLRATLRDDVLARLVDVDKALPLRGYQETGELTFKVIDDLCPWNTGAWKLEVDKQGSRVTKTRLSPQITLPVNTLAMLFYNQINATQALRMGRLDAPKPEALKDWDRIMSTPYKPACSDGF
ncbi:MAG: GNAT family N-acetyltransferase [Dehalococcoidales bacterium]|nr:GNAT family N-acetyltransferase [Dehalococcoidales bacterium]